MNPSPQLPPHLFDLARRRADRLRRAAMHRAWRWSRQRVRAWAASLGYPAMARPASAKVAVPCPR